MLDLKNKTLTTVLLENGVKKEEIDNHASDLYVKVTETSKKVLDEYEFKDSITTFRSEIDHSLWYEVPFGYAEYYPDKKDYDPNK